MRQLRTCAGAILLMALGACSAILGGAAIIRVSGVVRSVAEDWRYENPCSLFAGIQGRCDDTRAWDAQLVRPDGTSVRFWFFTSDQHGIGRPPAVGDSIEVTLHKRPIFPYMVCAQRAGVTSSCTPDLVYALDSVENYHPLR